MALLTKEEIDKIMHAGDFEKLVAHIRTLEHEMNERGIRTGMIHDALESAKAHILEQDKALAEAREALTYYAETHEYIKRNGTSLMDSGKRAREWLTEHPAPSTQ